MSTTNELEKILHKMWGGGLDWATSDDFKEIRDGDDVEAADEAYLKYQTNLTNHCMEALNRYIEDERVKAVELFERDINGWDYQSMLDDDDGGQRSIVEIVQSVSKKSKEYVLAQLHQSKDIK